MTTKTKEEIFKEVQPFVAEHFGVNKDKVIKSAYFEDDLGADSLDVVEMIMGIEETFEIKIPDEEAEKIRIINDLVQFIYNHQHQV